MKKLFYLFVIASLVVFSSCKKDKLIKDPSKVSACGVKHPINNLRWLNKIVQDAKKEGTDKYLSIKMAKYNGDTYFHSMLSYSSCWGCIIYNCDGSNVRLQNFTDEQKTELMQALNSKESVVLWGIRI